MVAGVWYLSQAMLVPAELIVYSMRRFICVLADWFLTHGDELLFDVHVEAQRFHAISGPRHILEDEVQA